MHPGSCHRHPEGFCRIVFRRQATGPLRLHYEAIRQSNRLALLQGPPLGSPSTPGWNTGRFHRTRPCWHCAKEPTKRHHRSCSLTVHQVALQPQVSSLASLPAARSHQESCPHIQYHMLQGAARLERGRSKAGQARRQACYKTPRGPNQATALWELRSWRGPHTSACPSAWRRRPRVPVSARCRRRCRIARRGPRPTRPLGA
mmetsp:Transcript_34825/g.92270  ORF Transcript_34825/g.92270 Transcript_34825/m.92270 type:complete len:202 (-) Transcript_34825:596-1201(-)